MPSLNGSSQHAQTSGGKKWHDIREAGSGIAGNSARTIDCLIREEVVHTARTRGGGGVCTRTRPKHANSGGKLLREGLPEGYGRPRCTAAACVPFVCPFPRPDGHTAAPSSTPQTACLTVYAPSVPQGKQSDTAIPPEKKKHVAPHRARSKVNAFRRRRPLPSLSGPFLSKAFAPTTAQKRSRAVAPRMRLLGRRTAPSTTFPSLNIC
ncbi:hypothetical protein MRX96_028656 [Rhipicephalus microplus]